VAIQPFQIQSHDFVDNRVLGGRGIDSFRLQHLLGQKARSFTVLIRCPSVHFKGYSRLSCGHLVLYFRLDVWSVRVRVGG
jgi:hypothetical protein